jgi:hypothetical protein
MSKGAIKELVRAGQQKFEQLTKDIPHSERREIIRHFEARITILNGDL